MVETRICMKCGEKFIGYGNTKYCLDCCYNDEGTKHPTQIIKLNIPIGELKMENQRNCLNCGKDISNRTHLAKWCVECSARRKRKQDIENHRLRNEAIKKKLRICKVCGKLITTPRLQIHKECKTERQKQNMKKWYKKHRKELGMKKRYKTHKHRFNEVEVLKVMKPIADTYTIVVINNRTKETKTYKMVEGGLI